MSEEKEYKTEEKGVDELLEEVNKIFEDNDCTARQVFDIAKTLEMRAMIAMMLEQVYMTSGEEE